MQPLFSAAGLARLAEVAQPGMMCVFDFDGTLVPITDEPMRAQLSHAVLARLVKLAARVPVAILTGRSIADIAPRLGFAPHYLIGNHGLEGLPGWDADLDRHAQCSQLWRQILDAQLGDRDNFDPAIWIEDKCYSLSVHYRAARDPAQSASKLSALFAQLEPAPRIVAGKCVFNLLPQGAADKGVALQRLLQESGAASAIYVGDDVTDEDVFRLDRDDLLSVRIEYLLGSAAEFYIPEYEDIVRLLDALIDRLADVTDIAQDKGDAWLPSTSD